MMDSPYFYATGMGRAVHAYTKEEWGMGSSQPSGDYSVHTATGLVVVTALMTIPALGAPLMLIVALASLNVIIVIFGLLGTVLFTGGWLLGVRSLRRELRASKKRKLKGRGSIHSSASRRAEALIYSSDQERHNDAV
jgi:hypothetical protein